MAVDQARGIRKEAIGGCPNNENIRCGGGDCGRCGWNPAVASRRKAKLTGTVEVYDESTRKIVGRMPWPVLGDMQDAYF